MRCAKVDLPRLRSNRGASAGELTAGLLGLARQRAGKGHYSGLKEAVEEPLDLLGRELKTRRIEVVRRLEAVPGDSLDLDLIAQICLNLYINARDAMKAKGGGRLEVSLTRRGGDALIEVSDSGTGIPESFRGRMFEPFQTTKGASGTGLGLSSSKTIVDAMGGEISFETEEGEGTRFRLRLPLR